MRASGTHGAVVNVTSAAGLRGGLSPSVDYTCSKAGMVMLTQQAACELARDGIRVNSVAPSFVSTVRTPGVGVGAQATRCRAVLQCMCLGV